MKLTTLKLGILALGLFAFSQGNAQNKKQPDPEKVFIALDTNKDGVISLEEFKNKKRKTEVSAEVIEKRYAKMDANADGGVTLNEFKEVAIHTGKSKGKKN